MALSSRPCLGGVFQRIGGGGKRESFFASIKFTRGKYAADDAFEELHQCLVFDFAETSPICNQYKT